MPNSLYYFPNEKLVFLQILHHSLMSWKAAPLDFFRSNITRKDQSKCKFLGLLSARIKTHQILIIFGTINQCSFNFLYQSWVPPNIISLYFLSWSIIYFGQKQPIKVNSFSNFASFFFVITHNSPVNFKLIHLLLGIKVPHKSPNFESQLSSALVKICQIPVIFQTTGQFFFNFCITLQCHER